MSCILCGKDWIQPLNNYGRDIHMYSCLACGTVHITDQAASLVRQKLAGHEHLLSGFTRRNTELGLPPVDLLSSNAIDLVSGADIPNSVADKINNLLLFFGQKSDFAGKVISLQFSTDYPLGFAKNEVEFEFLLRQLSSLGLVELLLDAPGQADVQVTIAGWNRISELSRAGRKSNQAFVAMWFTPETQTAYEEGIEKAIRQAGYDPLRVDKLEHNGKICDRIIAEIRKSAFLIADFTGHRGGVYYEVGFAMGLGIPVIWLCRRDQIDSAHFDTRQYNHIVWENETDLFEKLLNRINATIVR